MNPAYYTMYLFVKRVLWVVAISCALAGVLVEGPERVELILTAGILILCALYLGVIMDLQELRDQMASYD